ncbi:YopX family protein [Staphylococcus shinii]|uniref:YopX family protein n=1 Tax=Staphylococcus shinii TaxID=2912228 RepID=UPI00298F2742|nr:YopX family protein [Staphylococcus shinii]MDW8571177.1 YopX family protein [Staphylococcus shinii]MDW8572918.1 YopX family protein [Staphylococcus shinii]
MIPKFRAWDRKHNEMIRVVSINFDEKFIRGLTEVESNLDMESSYNFEDIELMQYTGLKDKNGVEIFEGDIIDKGYYNFSIENRIGYVEFNQGGDSDGCAHGDWLGWITNNNDSLLDVHEHCTVLANKFEHPHLLEE